MHIVLLTLEDYFPFNATKTNKVHVDDNLASTGHKKCTASPCSKLTAKLD